MKLIVGLGNPGPEYETTRHNAGFLVLDQIAAACKIPLDGKKFEAAFGKGEIFGQPCLLIKPMTFMNKSGKSVAQFMRFFKIEPADVVVIYDDIDVPRGKIKARIGGSAGGHNGIKSMIAEAGTDAFHRIKIGVGKPEEKAAGGTGWVLGTMTDEELLAMQKEGYEGVLIRLKNIFQA